MLSPAGTSGLRAAILLRERARFDLAQRLRSDEGAPIGEAFSFVSGLYFRGKLAYAARFAPGSTFVITSCAGLLPPETRVRHQDLRRYARVPIAPGVPAYRRPFLRDARRILREMPGASAVLLGSIATDKYSAVLLEVFGERLLFPAEFVGRGDMSRGGLLLRAARDGRELDYVPVASTVRHGPRPAKLDPSTRVRDAVASKRVREEKPD